MYAKCGSLVEARRVFDRISSRSLASWNPLLLGYAETGEPELALQLFARLLREGYAAETRTYVAVVKACTNLAAKEEGRELSKQVVKVESLEKGFAVHCEASKSSCESHIFVASALVDMYSNCGSMEDAQLVFDRMPYHDVVLWNALILGYAVNGDGNFSLQLMAQMKAEGCQPDARTFVAALKACSALAVEEDGREFFLCGKPRLVKVDALAKGFTVHSQAAKRGIDCSNVFVASALVDMYTNCGSLVDAKRVFDGTASRFDAVLCNALMLGFADNGEAEAALDLFTRMKLQGCEPNALTFSEVLKACGSVAALRVGKAIHGSILRSGLEKDKVLTNCLVDFYGKCGSMVDSQQVFDSVLSPGCITWTALIAGYSHLGETRLTFSSFERMQQEEVRANGITLGCILYACSHAGLVSKGKKYFQAMKGRFSIEHTLEHYHCMVDMLGRASDLEAALRLVETMPFQPVYLTWMILLGACKKWKNSEVGRIAFEALVKIDEREAAAYVLMETIYGSRGMWEEQARIEMMRVEARAWKKPAGRSWWTDDLGRVHSFIVGDTSHPQSEEINTRLKLIVATMKGHGYVADVGSVGRKVPEAEKEENLCGHSERLAIACALLNTAPGTTLRIMKNLRVCDDCHEATKIISRIEKRRIVCRDATRFHDFFNGECSCGNFW
ncbi:pentatricopeptide repeat-containing protein At5g16860-like [Selaginella moellendorffii]|uniref:pentatricopeptide repeat-containing protein At5g16860-like n=1 Tax=Selaginella moellendorffii TaxID=88036 RepID=UPI000D1C655D|nr:pentatricopeptide repeat-containing protein At5g16860-like [Selaginella moellendorffii]|eukprot:XP_024534094.1 pentatricopeptide repeat-containing protein At5g16860-like [Selaginella moellendorffii]